MNEVKGWLIYDTETENTACHTGIFRYSREILFTNTEQCSVERFINILFSQGSMQEVLKKSPQLVEKDIAEFKQCIKTQFGEQDFEIDFCYRMRIGIK